MKNICKHNTPYMGHLLSLRSRHGQINLCTSASDCGTLITRFLNLPSNEGLNLKKACALSHNIHNRLQQ